MAAPVLHNRVALVTGAESGIGAACAIAQAKAGASVAVCYFNNRDAADEVVRIASRADASAKAIQCDVRDETSVENAFDSARTLGVPDILINSAGLNESGVAVADMPSAQWRRLLDTDLTGAVLTCRRFIRDLEAI